MTIGAHIAELERRHHELEKKIAEAVKHNSIDDLEVVELKRQKLYLKDEIERLQHDGVVPTIAQKSPYLVEVEAGKTYHWCTCGNSKTQPYCDGSHKGSTFTPMTYIPGASAKVALCGCKHTKNQPMCDGSHKAL